MDTYENEYITQPAKKSPYADSPYECVYTEPEIVETPKPSKPKRKGRPLLVLLLLICACSFFNGAVITCYKHGGDHKERQY